ncbi:MAG TPA: hypothetical protein VGV38_20060 [Pyrinomonadaceae bacterium]|nr:hypothetical protein [Pyrinomonadaceae bacterium]
MNELNNRPESPAEQSEPNSENLTRNKKPFVEPAVSVPVDVLEATSFFFQDTTIDTSDV